MTGLVLCAAGWVVHFHLVMTCLVFHVKFNSLFEHSSSESSVYFSDNRKFETSYFCIFNKLAVTFDGDIFMNNDRCP